MLGKIWDAMPGPTRAVLVLVVLAAAAILALDPAPAHYLRDELIGLFLAGILAVGFAVCLLLVVTLSGGAFAAIWGRGYETAEAKIHEHRGVAVPTFLSVISGLTVAQATQVIGSLTGPESILLGAITTCFTGLGAMLQEHADKYRDLASWRWARRIGMALVILPLFALMIIGVADDWWSYFFHADGIDQACLILTFVIEVITVIAGWALNKGPQPKSGAVGESEVVQSVV